MLGLVQLGGGESGGNLVLVRNGVVERCRSGAAGVLGGPGKSTCLRAAGVPASMIMSCRVWNRTEYNAAGASETVHSTTRECDHRSPRADLRPCTVRCALVIDVLGLDPAVTLGQDSFHHEQLAIIQTV